MNVTKQGNPCCLVKEKKKSLVMYKDSFQGYSTVRILELNADKLDKYVHLFTKKEETGSLSGLKNGVLNFLDDLILCSRVLCEYGYVQNGFNSWKRKCSHSACMLSETGVFIINHVHKIHFQDEMSLRLALVEYEKHNLSIDSLSQLNPKIRDLVLMA